MGAQQAVGGGRAADVASADEKNLDQRNAPDQNSSLELI
jgi:hypothetical protein